MVRSRQAAAAHRSAQKTTPINNINWSLPGFYIRTGQRLARPPPVRRRYYYFNEIRKSVKCTKQAENTQKSATRRNNPETADTASPAGHRHITSHITYFSSSAWKLINRKLRFHHPSLFLLDITTLKKSKGEAELAVNLRFQGDLGNDEKKLFMKLSATFRGGSSG